MSKGSRLARAVQFFEEGDIREARVAFTLVNEIMAKRLGPKTAARKRTRRTKAQIESARQPEVKAAAVAQ